MVRITHKHPTYRLATAVQTVLFSHAATYPSLINANLRKGDAMAVARVAGIQAAKRTAELIPLAHPGVGIESVVVEITPFRPRVDGEVDERGRGQQRSQIADGIADGDETATNSETAAVDVPLQLARSHHGGVYISATVSCTAKTGVEMEALTAATVAGLAMYDMLKGVDKGMKLAEARVVRKEGGKSGGWVWDWERSEVVRVREGSAVAKK